MPDELFPAGAPVALGYPHVAFRGMKGYNGVAIFSRLPIQVLPTARRTGAQRGIAGTSAVLLDVRVRAGRAAQFLCAGRRRCPRPRAKTRNSATSSISSRRRRLGSPARARRARTVLVGDLNIAPLEHDVWSHKQLLDVVSHTPPETKGLLAWQKRRLHRRGAAFRAGGPKLYTWWSYRNRDWRASDRGRRLDHVWVSPDLQGRAVSHTVLKDARDWPQGQRPRAGLHRAGSVREGRKTTGGRGGGEKGPNCRKSPPRLPASL